MSKFMKNRFFKYYSFAVFGVSSTCAILVNQYRLKKLNNRNINEKLIGVQLITRHGATTPSFLLPGIETVAYTEDMLAPYVKAKITLKPIGDTVISSDTRSDRRSSKNKLKDVVAAGQLTTVGERQMFDLGRLLKNRYIDKLGFLKTNYDPNDIYTRASYNRRTILSAKSLIAGLYGIEPKDESVDFVIYIHDSKDDWTTINLSSCQFMRSLYNNRRDLFKKIDNQEYKNECTKLRNYLGKPITFSDFRTDVSARLHHNLPVPKELEPFAKKMDLLAGMEVQSMLDIDIKLFCGIFLHLISNNITKFINNYKNNDPYHKLVFYSSHSTTLMALLKSLNNDNTIVRPQCASCLLIELWQKQDNGEYYVRLIYLETMSDVENFNKYNNYKRYGKELKVDDFIELLKQTSIEESSYRERCKKPYNIN